jgi:hypothetical protein
MTAGALADVLVGELMARHGHRPREEFGAYLDGS